MVNYKVVKDAVVEQLTGLTVRDGLTAEQAKELCRQLNFGGGFDGFTPAFFLERPSFTYFKENNYINNSSVCV